MSKKPNTKPKKKKQSWEREDKLLDYIVGHKTELTRYLIVVLCSELEKYLLLYNLLYLAFPVLLKFDLGLTFLLWGLPYFVACKYWVWKKPTDAYTAGAQGLKFAMCYVVIYFVIGWLHKPIFTELLMMGRSSATMVSHLLEEIFYFIAMFKIVIQPEKK